MRNILGVAEQLSAFQGLHYLKLEIWCNIPVMTVSVIRTTKTKNTREVKVQGGKKNQLCEN
jgi:hypothetical protein